MWAVPTPYFYITWARNYVVEWLGAQALLYILKVPESNISQETSYADGNICFPLQSSKKKTELVLVT
jgi:hypothetical protein